MPLGIEVEIWGSDNVEMFELVYYQLIIAGYAGESLFDQIQNKIQLQQSNCRLSLFFRFSVFSLTLHNGS